MQPEEYQMADVLTDEQLEGLRHKLEKERDRLLRVLRATAPTASEVDQVSEVEEAAQRTAERTEDIDLEARERPLLAEVERALAKLRAGHYGVSETSGEPIPYRRLAAVPWARQAIED